MTCQHQKSTHIRGQTRLAIQFLFKFCDELWDCPIVMYLQAILFDIGTHKGSPRLHLDENVSVISSKTQLNKSVNFKFRQRIRQIS